MTDADRPDDAASDEESVEGEGAAAEESATPPDGAEEPAAGVPTPDEVEAEDEPASEGELAPEPASEGEPAPAPEQPEGSSAPAADAGAGPEAAGEEAEAPPPERDRGARSRGRGDEGAGGPEAIPGAHLEPDLVLEEQQETEEPDYSRYADVEPEAELEAEAADAGDPTAATAPTDREQPAPAPRSALDLAADARYGATGKRKTSVARVILRPGSGAYTVNGRPLDEFFPRSTLQLAARQPLQAAGYEDRMDVVARLHGGGVSSQAGALRHGIARALVEADPALRGELKRRGFLTRDARAKERRKAGLKKARKRPQFSKR
jgi:small subunit ribosomal protein S9